MAARDQHTTNFGHRPLSVGPTRDLHEPVEPEDDPVEGGIGQLQVCRVSDPVGDSAFEETGEAAGLGDHRAAVIDPEQVSITQLPHFQSDAPRATAQIKERLPGTKEARKDDFFRFPEPEIHGRARIILDRLRILIPVSGFHRSNGA
jgi:hypothetical protein